MCGLAGIVGFPSSTRARGLVRRLSQELQHRGPDDEGYLVFNGRMPTVGREAPEMVPEGATVLIHRRLSILDLTEAGWQPMGTSDRRFYIILNGEIYNYLELRQELEALGVRFRSHGDTEVLLAAYAMWGSACLTRLVGMFAFAVIDTIERRLFLARDFFGIKPLYYAFVGGSFIFASEVNALLACPGISREVDPQRLYLYLRYAVADHGDGTLLANIRQVEPAHFLDLSLDDPRHAEPTRYWNLGSAQPQDISFDEAAKRVRDLFLTNIQLHLRSDVPVGAALSGGIDSSAVVACMRYVGGSKLSLHAYSYIADDQKLSEERWVDIATRSSGAAIHKIRSSGRELLEQLPNLIRAQGEPFGGTSIFAQYLVFRQASRSGIKVMLDGQGADEILAGYRPFLAARCASLLRTGQFSAALRFATKWSRLPGVTRPLIVAQMAAAMLPPSVQEPFRRRMGRSMAPSWLNRHWLDAHGVELRAYHNTTGKQALIEELCTSIRESSLPRLLRYEDRNSMAFSIESRVPFLTPDLVNFLLSLPESYILADDGTSKAVFRAAMAGIVPDEILDRRDKIGFATPDIAWLGEQRDWAESILASEAAAATMALDLAEVRREAQRVSSGTAVSGEYLWRCLNLIAWVKEFEVRVG
jgi:asparagine synthase (glutamine-hydrolysing)